MARSTVAGERVPPRGRRRGDPPSLIAATAPGALGLLLVVLGWIGVSGEATFDEQMAGLNVAILGAIVVLAGCGFYLYVFRIRMHRRVATVRTAILSEYGEAR